VPAPGEQQRDNGDELRLGGLMAKELPMSAIRKQIVTPKDPRMPAYMHLSPQDLDDLVNYLVSLQ